MLVLVCGMHRSGSTLVWQVTRALLSGRPDLRHPRSPEVESFAAAAADPQDLLMAKVHYRPVFSQLEFPHQGALYLYTYRDVRDAIASLYRKGRWEPDDPRRGPRNARAAARRELLGDSLWTSMPTKWVARYEDFRDDVPRVIRSLAVTLDVPVSDARVDDIAAEVSLKAQQRRAAAAAFVGIDAEDRITPNHITDGRAGAWRETLTPEEAGAIEVEAAVWLATHGYEIETDLGRRTIKQARRVRQAERVAARERAAQVAAAKEAERQAEEDARRRAAQRSRQRKVIGSVALVALAAVTLVVGVALGASMPWRIGTLAVTAVAAAGVGYLLGGWSERERGRAARAASAQARATSVEQSAGWGTDADNLDDPEDPDDDYRDDIDPGERRAQAST